MIMKKIYVFLILIFIFLLNACSNQVLNINSPNMLEIISEDFFTLKESLETEAFDLASDPKVIEAFRNSNFENLNLSSSFNQVSYFTIQGKSYDETSSIRDTTMYRHLMGHMDFSGQLLEINNQVYYSIIAKVFLNNNEFLGILKLDYPLVSFSEEVLEIYPDKELYLLDDSHNIYNLNNNKILTL